MAPSTIDLPSSDEARKNETTILRHPFHTLITPHTTILDLSPGTYGMGSRLDPTFAAFLLSLIPTLEHVRIRNLILEFSEHGPWSTKVHLPRLQSFFLIDNCPGIVALLDHLSIPLDTELDIEVNTPTSLTTSIELIATVGYIIEGNDDGVARRFETLSVIPEYGRLVVKGYEYLLPSGDPDAVPELRLSLPSPDWDVRNGLVEGIAYGWPLPHVRILHTDISILNTLTDNVLCYLLDSLPSLRALAWTDSDLPPPDEDEEDIYWDSHIRLRVGGVSNLFPILWFMKDVIDDEEEM